jgi:hypothetical protein
VRVRLREENYWNYFERQLTAAEFEKMAGTNARAYLGLRGEAPAPKKNIENYVRFIYGAKHRMIRSASAWVKDDVKTFFGPTATLPDPGLGPQWTWNNEAHARTWSIMKDQMRPADRNLEFADAGRLRLRQMQYWNKEFEDSSIWAQKLAAMAENIDSGCRANKAVFEVGYDVNKALGELKETLNKGDQTLSELAMVCDRIYRFRRET